VRPSPFLPPLLLLGAFFAACGFDGIGGALDGEGSRASATPGAEGGAGSAGAEGDGGPAGQTEGGGVPVITDAGLDDTGLVDAAVPHDAGPPLPTNPGPPLAYVVSGRFWTFDPTTGAWSGGTSLPANDCPALDELAVDPFGVLFAVGNNATALYRVDPTTLTCTAIGPAGTYPQSLAFAPRGTLDPYTEVLVGYAANGDYVRIDTTTGAQTVVSAGALAGLVVGDLVNVGLKGYVAVNGGSCGTGDCIWEISFSTGKAIAPGLASAKLPSATHVTGLAHWSGKLQAFCGPDEVYSLDPTNAAGATPRTGPSGYVNVVYHGAGSRTIAPTN